MSKKRNSGFYRQGAIEQKFLGMAKRVKTEKVETLEEQFVRVYGEDWKEKIQSK